MCPLNRCFLLLALAGAALRGQSASPCGTTAANRDVTGSWGPAAGGFLIQTGSTFTGGYVGTPPHGGLVGTLSGGTIDATETNLTASITITEGSITDVGVYPPNGVIWTLSQDANTLTGTVAYYFNGTTGLVGPSAFNWTRSSGTVTLVPNMVTLTAAQGGMAVTDNSTLMLYNCGAAPSKWQAAVGTAWLSVQPSSGTLAVGASTILTLTATPGNLLAKNSPFMDGVTISAQDASSTGPGDFGATIAAVQFKLTNGPDEVSLSDVGPAPGVTFESSTNENFSANVTGTLNSADSANLQLQVVDGATGMPLPGAVSQTVQVKSAGTFMVEGLAIDTFQIPDGTKSVQLQAVLQTPNAQPTIVTGGTYDVFPRPKLTVQATSEVWTGALPALAAALNFIAGSPDRTTVTLKVATSLGQSLGSATVDVRSGSGNYAAGFTNLTVPAGISSLTVTATLPALNGVLDEIDQTFMVQVDPAPTISSFQLLGPNKQFVDASQPIVFDSSFLEAQVGYTLPAQKSGTGNVVRHTQWRSRQ